MDARRCYRLLPAAFVLLLNGCGGSDDDLIPAFYLENGIVATDLDADGRVDVAVAVTYIAGPPPHPGYLDVYLQTQPGVFQPPARYAISVDPWELASGDIDADGRPDLVAATPTSVPPQPSQPGTTGAVSILRQDPAAPGRFLAAQRLHTGGVADAAAVGEFTGDAFPDIVVADGVIVNARGLLFAQDPAQPDTFLAPVTLPIGAGGAVNVAIADINGDGRQDVAFATDEANAVALFHQNAGGGFAPVILLPTGIRPQDVEARDIDGDGRMDLITANAGNAPGGGTGGSSVSLLLQTAPGSFSRRDIAVTDAARRVTVADLNDDGIPDLGVISIVYASQGLPRMTVLLQSAAIRGQFSGGGVYEAPFGASFIAAGDANGDALNDILISDGPSVFLQQAGAPGTFAAYRPLR
jgi:hypothetical protein